MEPSFYSSAFIPSIPENIGKRPLWSVMIPVRFAGSHLRETIESVLSNNIPEDEMHIEVIGSTEVESEVEKLVTEVGKGRVKYFCIKEGGGQLQNLKECVNRSTGEYVHILQGDDRVKPGFYESLDKLFWHYPEAGAAFCCSSWINGKGAKIIDDLPEMDRKGILPDWLPQIAERNLIPFASIAVKREVYEKLGGFCGPKDNEGWEMWTRIARFFPIAYTPSILVENRQHSCPALSEVENPSLNSNHLLTAMELIQQHLPKDIKQLILMRSKRFHAHLGMEMAQKIWTTTQDKKYVRKQINHALAIHRRGVAIYWGLLKIHLKMKFNIL